MTRPPQTPLGLATNVVVVPFTVTFTVAPAAAVPPTWTLPLPETSPPVGTVTVGGGGAAGSAAVKTSGAEKALVCPATVCRAAS